MNHSRSEWHCSQCYIFKYISPFHHALSELGNQEYTNLFSIKGWIKPILGYKPNNIDDRLSFGWQMDLWSQHN